ncbi:MAG: hypothetical protein V8T46_02845 [Sutterella seckii]
MTRRTAKRPAARVRWELEEYTLSKQTQLFHLMAVLCAGGHDVDACRVDAAVTENICQFCNILLHTIESPAKTVSPNCGETPCPDLRLPAHTAAS